MYPCIQHQVKILWNISNTLQGSLLLRSVPYSPRATPKLTSITIYDIHGNTVCILWYLAFGHVSLYQQFILLLCFPDFLNLDIHIVSKNHWFLNIIMLTSIFRGFLHSSMCLSTHFLFRLIMFHLTHLSQPFPHIPQHVALLCSASFVPYSISPLCHSWHCACSLPGRPVPYPLLSFLYTCSRLSFNATCSKQSSQKKPVLFGIPL